MISFSEWFIWNSKFLCVISLLKYKSSHLFGGASKNYKHIFEIFILVEELVSIQMELFGPRLAQDLTFLLRETFSVAVFSWVWSSLWAFSKIKEEQCVFKDLLFYLKGHLLVAEVSAWTCFCKRLKCHSKRLAWQIIAECKHSFICYFKLISTTLEVWFCLARTAAS